MYLNELICKYLLVNFVKSFEIRNTGWVISIFVVQINYTVRHFDWFRLTIFWRTDVTDNNVDVSFFFYKTEIFDINVSLFSCRSQKMNPPFSFYMLMLSLIYFLNRCTTHGSLLLNTHYYYMASYF